MKKNQAILVLISIFILSAALGVGGTWGVKKIGTKSSVDDSGLVAVTGGGGGGSISPANPVEPTPTPTPTPEPSQGYTPVQEQSPQVPDQRVQSPIDNIPAEKDNGKSLGDGNNPTMPTANITLVSTTGPTPNPETRTYSFTATASGGWGQYTYYLYPTKNAQDTLVSTSGRFTNVAPSSTGKYMLVIKDRAGKELTKEIRGFTAILNKLTTQQLTTRLSKSTPDQGLGKYFASGYKIKFTGLNSGDPVPTSYTQIYSNIASGYWSKVKVTAVEFNGYNKITKITVSVYYN